MEPKGIIKNTVKNSFEDFTMAINVSKIKSMFQRIYSTMKNRQFFDKSGRNTLPVVYLSFLNDF